MIYSNPEIAELFNDETIHVLDYDCEYDVEVDRQKFPEYKNSMWNHFNTDTSMTTGHFRFGDVESGATMLLKVNHIFYIYYIIISIISIYPYIHISIMI